MKQWTVSQFIDLFTEGMRQQQGVFLSEHEKYNTETSTHGHIHA